jgi:alkylated DNA repair dioxygenase AlkB
MTAAAFQASLLDCAPSVEVGRLAGSVRRTGLTEGAWIDFRPRWISGADTLFERLHAAVPWHAERRPMYDRVVDVPRLVHTYGEDEPLPHVLLGEARAALSAHYRPELGEPFLTAGSGYYRDGRDSVAWHGDRVAKTLVEPVVAILSLGSERTLRLRPKGGAKEGARATHPFRLIPGDLFVMGGTTQATWQHSVPKVARAGARVSLQFRHST